MQNIAFKKIAYYAFILMIIFGIAWWVVGMRKINDKVPTKGTFVNSKTIYLKNLVSNIAN